MSAGKEMIRMKKRIICLLLCLLLIPFTTRAEEPEDFFENIEADAIGTISGNDIYFAVQTPQKV